MPIEDTTPEDMTVFETLIEKQQKINDALDYKKFTMNDIDISKKIDKLQESVDALSVKINGIFGAAVLVNGRFIDTSKFEGGG